jgi:hypothetical protein
MLASRTARALCSRQPQRKRRDVRVKVLNAGSWPVERINCVLKEYALLGWKLIAVTGHGLCGVQLWLER